MCCPDCCAASPCPRWTATALRRCRRRCRRCWSAGARTSRCAAPREDIAEHAQRLEQLAGELGRPAPGIALVAFTNVGSDRALLREQSAQFIAKQYGMPFEKVEHWALLGDVDEVAERIAEYRAAGVSGFCLSAAHPRPLEQVEALAAVREAVAVAA